ncbi:vacuolar import and degradation protein 30-like, partial [Clarias magur]
MAKPPTLNELKQLEESGFGQFYPRHGLKLLYWFANDCLYFDDYNRMCWQYDPDENDFGFRLFENRNDKSGERLLPDVNLDYYEVGNLRRKGADDLPDYVREDDDIQDHDSNMDRIIVSVDDEYFDRVYVTEHSDQADFNKEATYCISRGLIMIIRNLTIEDFLSKTG